MLRKFRDVFKVLFHNGLVLDPSSAESVRAFLISGETFDTSYAGPKNCATVFSCIRLLSDAISSLPLKLFMEDTKGQKELAKSNPLYWVLSISPCPWMDKVVYWKFNVNCLLLRGLFLSLIIRNNTGKVMRLVPVNPIYIDIANIERDSFGELVFPVSNEKGGYTKYPARDCFFAYYETLDGIRPVTPLQYSKNTVRLAVKSEKYGIDTLEKGAVLPGYYSTENKIGAESFERLKKELAEIAIGDKSGRAPLLDSGLKYNVVTMTAGDMQMLETRRYQKEELCGIFGVPPHLIGDTAQAKGWSTMEQTMTEFLQLSLTPYLVRIENAITTRLIPENSWGSQYAKFSIDGLLRGDLTARTNFYRNLYNTGAISANEVRAKEDMNAFEGGDQYFRPSNMTPADQTTETAI